MLAVGGMLTRARRALAAVCKSENDVITDVQVAHVRAFFDHNSGALVTEHERQWDRKVLIPHYNVGMTHPGRLHLHDDLVRARATQRRGLQFEGTAGLPHDGSRDVALGHRQTFLGFVPRR